MQILLHFRVTVLLTFPCVLSSSTSASESSLSASLSSARRFRRVFSIHSISSAISSWCLRVFSNCNSAIRLSVYPSIKSLQGQEERHGIKIQDTTGMVPRGSSNPFTLTVNESKLTFIGKKRYFHVATWNAFQGNVLTCVYYVSELLVVALLLHIPTLPFHAEVSQHFEAIFPSLYYIYALLLLTIYLCICETLSNTQCLLALRLHSPTYRRQNNKIKTYFLIQSSDTGTATERIKPDC